MTLAALRAVHTRLTTVPVRAGLTSSADPDASLPGNAYFNRLGERARRDMPDSTRRESVERAMDFLDHHPLASRYASILQEWIVPEDFKPKAKDPKVQAIVDRFYEDKRNDWEALLPEYSDVKAATGELFFPAFVNPIDGKVVLDYWDPAEVKRVLFHPKYRRIPRALEWAGPGMSNPLEFHAIVPQVEESHPMFGRLMGRDPRQIPRDDTLNGIAGALIFRFNKRPNSERGRGDIVPCLDYWAGHDDFLGANVERAQLLSRFIGDVTVKGARDQGGIEEARARYAKEPAYGTLAFHNEQEIWNLAATDLKASDMAEFERVIRTFGSAATGVPPHILSGDFTEGNRAVATSTMDPAYLRAKSKQRQLARVVKICCIFAVDSAFLVAPKQLEGVEDWAVDVATPALLKKDPAAAAPLVANVTAALIQALTAHLIDTTSARIVFLRVLAELGVEEISVESVERGLSQAGHADAQTSTNLKELADKLQDPKTHPNATPANVGPPPEAKAMAALRIVKAVAGGRLPRDSGKAQLQTFLGLSDGQAETIMGSAGKAAA